MTKNIKYDFFALLFKNGTLGHKICTFIRSWQATHAKKCQFYALLHNFKSRSKKSYLYFCHEIVFHYLGCKPPIRPHFIFIFFTIISRSGNSVNPFDLRAVRVAFYAKALCYTLVYSINPKFCSVNESI